MILIATDEAGYGPTLGPLLVTATCWRSGWDGDPASMIPFARLSDPLAFAGGKIVVDDSKRVHQPSSARRRSPSGDHFDPLLLISAAAAQWCGQPMRHRAELHGWLVGTKRADGPPWLQAPDAKVPLPSQIDQIVSHWQHGSNTAQFIDAKSSELTAAAMNQKFVQGLNKSDILGETTMKLVAESILKLETKREGAMKNEDATTDIHVFCDRLGGRRYYAGLIQHHFPEAQLRIIEEQRYVSRYALTTPSGRNIEIRFSVKGDSFAPVAMSSCLSKFLREDAMANFNRYFAEKIKGLKPTAGYPQDAKRFLTDIEPLRRELAIADNDLIRAR